MVELYINKLVGDMREQGYEPVFSAGIVKLTKKADRFSPNELSELAETVRTELSDGNEKLYDAIDAIVITSPEGSIPFSLGDGAFLYPVLPYRKRLDAFTC